MYGQFQIVPMMQEALYEHAGRSIIGLVLGFSAPEEGRKKQGWS